MEQIILAIIHIQKNKIIIILMKIIDTHSLKNTIEYNTMYHLYYLYIYSVLLDYFLKLYKGPAN